MSINRGDLSMATKREETLQKKDRAPAGLTPDGIPSAGRQRLAVDETDARISDQSSLRSSMTSSNPSRTSLLAV